MPLWNKDQDRDRFDKFTERARKVLVLAQEEAQQHHHQWIGTEHLLLGLIRESEGVGARALVSLGVNLEEVRARIEYIIGTGERAVTGEIGMTRRAKKVVLELAAEEAKVLKHNYIGTEHLLLGLIREGEGIAAKVLVADLHVNWQDARTQVLLLLLQTRGDTGLSAGPKSNVITFRLDDRDLDALDALVEAGIRSTRSDAAAWLIRAGIEAQRPLFERVYTTVAEIRHLRATARKMAEEVTGGAPAPEAPNAGEASPSEQEPPAASA
jgi:Arc/MetJ-type ribon-helix-helix transcriptional regulator